MSTATAERANVAGRPEKKPAAYIRVPAYLADMLKILAVEAGVSPRDYFEQEFRAEITRRYKQASERLNKRTLGQRD